MKEIRERIDSIVERIFDRDFFLDQTGETRNKVKEEIKIFERKNPQFQMSLYEELQEKFPSAKVENWTHFFSNDRCVRFLIEINNELRFVAQISIFNFFSVYQHPMNYVGNRYTYGDIVFINKDESEIGNQIYKCISRYNDKLVWLPNDILNERINDLSIIKEDMRYGFEVTISDVLFTKNYL